MLGILTARSTSRVPEPESYLFQKKKSSKRYWLLMLICVAEDVVLGVFESEADCDAAAQPFVEELEAADADQNAPLPPKLEAAEREASRCGDSKPVCLIRIEATNRGAKPTHQHEYYSFI